MADNKKDPNQKDRTNDAVGMPANDSDSNNQRKNNSMETQGGKNAGNRNEKSGQGMAGGSDRMDTPGDATRGEQSGNREAQGGSRNQPQGGSKNQAEGGSNRGAQGGNQHQTQNQSDRKDNMEKRPSGSDELEEGEDRDTREKRPA